MKKSFEFPLNGLYINIDASFEREMAHEDSIGFYTLCKVNKLIACNEDSEFVEVTPTLRKEIIEMTEDACNDLMFGGNYNDI